MRPLLALVLVACTGGSVTEPSDGTDDSDTPTCEVLDCANPACADEFQCTWPDALDLVTDIDFRGDTIDCFIPVDIDDCVTDATAMLTPTDVDPCTACDRTYDGPMTYQTDTCSELIDTVPPERTAVGVVFVSPTERELWGRDDAGVWSLGATVTGSDGVFSVTTVEDIEQDIEECRQGVQKLGTMTAVLTFTDRD